LRTCHKRSGEAGARLPARALTVLHVLFLNAQDGLGADIAVHLSLARA